MLSLKFAPITRAMQARRRNHPQFPLAIYAAESNLFDDERFFASNRRYGL